MKVPYKNSVTPTAAAAAAAANNILNNNKQQFTEYPHIHKIYIHINRTYRFVEQSTASRNTQTIGRQSII